MPLLPGSEPWHADGGRTGFLLCHGFTGSPASLRPWAEHHAAAGLTVSLPRLPGHGTTWQDMALTRWPDWYATVERALAELTARCDQVFVGGLSMGGTLALRLAEEHAEDVAGLVLVNPSVLSTRQALRALPLVSRYVPSVRGLVNDIKKDGPDEIGYDRAPLASMHSLTQLWSLVRADLAKVTAPLLLLHSIVDHIVEPHNAEVVLEGVGSSDVTEVLLYDSFHVATLDNDAPLIFARSLEHVQRLTTDAPAYGRTSSPGDGVTGTTARTVRP